MSKENGRAPNGMGSISYRAGRRKPYQAQVSIGKRKTKSFRHKSEAVEWIQNSMSEFRKDPHRYPEKITLIEVSRKWKAFIKPSEPYNEENGEISPKTYDVYVWPLHAYIENSWLGSMPIKEILPFHITEFFLLIKARGKSVSTQSKILSTLKKIFAFACDNRLCQNNPTSEISIMYKPPKKPPLTKNEVDNLIKVCYENDRLFPVVAMFIFVGLRRGELVGLRWRDVDLKSGKITIQNQVIRVTHFGLVEKKPKSDSERIVFVSQKVLDILSTHKKKQNLLKLTSSSWKDSDYVFPSTIGTVWDPDNLYDHIKDLFDLAGIKNHRLHDLRITNGSLMVDAGINQRVIQERLGHKDIRTTERYTAVSSYANKKAAEALEAEISLSSAAELQQEEETKDDN